MLCTCLYCHKKIDTEFHVDIVDTDNVVTILCRYYPRRIKTTVIKSHLVQCRYILYCYGIASISNLFIRIIMNSTRYWLNSKQRIHCLNQTFLYLHNQNVDMSKEKKCPLYFPYVYSGMDPNRHQAKLKRCNICYCRYKI